MMQLPPRVAQQVKVLQARWPSGGYGTVHTTLYLAPRELLRCPASGCLEHAAFRATCRACGSPTVPLWSS